MAIVVFACLLKLGLPDGPQPNSTRGHLSGARQPRLRRLLRDGEFPREKDPDPRWRQSCPDGTCCTLAMRGPMRRGAARPDENVRACMARVSTPWPQQGCA